MARMTVDEKSRCCGAPLGRPRDSEALSVAACARCGTLWATHRRPSSATKPWDASYVPREFVSALEARRRAQATAIADAFAGALGKGRVLDYACGQGLFLRELVDRGLDATGCDLDAEVPSSVVPAGPRRLTLAVPWEVPKGDWHTVALLDVLEHHPAPIRFLKSLGARQLLVKVPLVEGPSGLVARLLARLGRPRLLEALMLVGELAPHQAYFTVPGLLTVAERAGFVEVRRLRLAEVGRELPERLRVEVPSPLRRLARGGGRALEALSPTWSDTAVFLFARAGLSAA